MQLSQVTVSSKISFTLLSGLLRIKSLREKGKDQNQNSPLKCYPIYFKEVCGNFTKALTVIMKNSSVIEIRIIYWIAQTFHECNSYYFTQYNQEFKLTLNSFTFSMVIRRLDVWLESICSQLLISFRHGWRGMISSVYLEEINIHRAVMSWTGRLARETKFIQIIHKMA